VTRHVGRQGSGDCAKGHGRFPNLVRRLSLGTLVEGADFHVAAHSRTRTGSYISAKRVPRLIVAFDAGSWRA
jgi:hypothetical protein